jgi:hypothetical protein
MLLAQGQGDRVEGVLVGTSGSGLVGGSQALGLVAPALQQLADGAGTQPQGGSNGRGGLTATRPLLDQAAQRQRQWGRHDDPRTKGVEYEHSLCLCQSAAKPLLRD